MTVEQPALQRFGQTKSVEDHTYATVKEITGITDRKRICQAIEACRNNDGKYEDTEVVNMLISDTAVKAENTNEKKMAITYPKEKDSVDAVAGPQQNLNKNSKGVIDLTNVSDTNETEDIQKAIAASLADSTGPYQQETTPGILGGQVSREEQDISRVLEQSLIESKAGTKRKRGDLWFVDPLNPHERKRNDDWPIGLKNVGNTCWFSAVIQSLFLLRRFRHLVLTYQPNKEASQTGTGNIEVRRNLRFMQELRHLFALMVGSKRKYVDPSKAVDILKEAFSSTVVSNTSVTDSQQDVSEFQHKLLDWLEDAFKSASRPSSPTEKTDNTSSGEKTSCSNPMVDLFYGQYRADGVNEGKGFSNEETFGQFPLQVNGFRDIHESLEAATAHREIETVNSETTQKSGQELWFTRLPPVLTFELSRFQFNQQIGRPEKIHNKIEFPQVIYMDRYLDCNRNETRHRREQAKKLKEELVLLQAKLDKFVNYGSGVKRFPLQDVLLYALEFAKSRPDTVRKSAILSQDVDMECPSPNVSMSVDSPIKSPADVVMAPVTSPSPLQSPEPSMKSPSTASTSPTLPQPIPDVPMTPVSQGTSASSTPPDIAMGSDSGSSPNTKSEHGLRSPQPRHVTETELVVLQNCLHRWRTEVESDVRELQENISRLEDSINKMYSDEAMTKNAYHLHAVLVHEGQAASGHYWAYIYDSASDQWLKFNDITVSEASWEELEKESVGGYHNASAYCLMYIDKSKIADEEVSGKPGSSMASDLENLPDDLKELVAGDNKVFAEEIEKWDRDVARKASGAGDADVTIVSEQKPALLSPASSSSTVSTQTVVQQTLRPSYASVHAYISAHESLAALRKVLESNIYDTSGPREAMQSGIELEHKRIKNVVENISREFPTRDPRLQHIVTYMMHCECSNELILIMLLEQFAELIREDNEKIKKMKASANEWRKKLLSDSEKIEKHYQFWHETYQIYRKTAALFIRGVMTYFDEKYVAALAYLIHAHRLSEELKKRHKNACLPEPKISAFFLRQTLLQINDCITQQFEDASDVTALLDSMKSHVLPCLQTVINSGSQEDITAVEEIREKWCSFLGQEMEAQKIEQLQDFLSKLFEPPLDLHIPKIPSLKHESFQNLAIDFAKVMENARDYGYIERALKNS
ncbi:ubiquitin carboxyl-terminal hydrolase 25-like isoform X2 [Ruditapes philippinarum]|uniref:ubiquitin carboxyl-terminal hydrolase 25-like isoform X2 n=1 Tax=Ruditapes philippinarum TaxID=129788 RepID=UPI00295B4C89|nr:ubiquitin carboxyl-terminal hydrolase 25-like isoform X2 [Ruditapes philippinarum]